MSYLHFPCKTNYRKKIGLMLVSHCQQGSSTLHYSTFYPKPNSFQKLRLLVSEICVQFWDHNNGVEMIMYVYGCIQAWFLYKCLKCFSFIDLKQQGSSAFNYSTFYPKSNSSQKLRLLVSEICAQFWCDNNGVGMVIDHVWWCYSSLISSHHITPLSKIDHRWSIIHCDSQLFHFLSKTEFFSKVEIAGEWNLLTTIWDDNNGVGMIMICICYNDICLINIKTE